MADWLLWLGCNWQSNFIIYWMLPYPINFLIHTRPYIFICSQIKEMIMILLRYFFILINKYLLIIYNTRRCFCGWQMQGEWNIHGLVGWVLIAEWWGVKICSRWQSAGTPRPTASLTCSTFRKAITRFPSFALIISPNVDISF